VDLPKHLEIDIEIEFSLMRLGSTACRDVPNLPHDVENHRDEKPIEIAEPGTGERPHIARSVRRDHASHSCVLQPGSLILPTYLLLFSQVSKSMILARSCGISDATREGCVTRYRSRGVG
jgi:hypothetical protein